MTWTKLSDDFTDDTWNLSDAAFRLHLEGLVWSNRKLLDLRIPKAELRRFGKNPDAANELVENGWWSEDRGFYLIRHHARYQRSREAVIRQQAVNKQNRAKRGLPQKPARELGVVRTEPSDESIDDSFDEQDWTGQAGIRTGDPERGEVVDSSEPITGWVTTPIPNDHRCRVSDCQSDATGIRTGVCPSQDLAHTEFRTRHGWET